MVESSLDRAAVEQVPAQQVPTVRRSRWVLLTLLVPLAVLLSACGGGESDDEASEEVAPDAQPVSGGKLVYAIAEDPDGFNPAANRVSFAGQSMLKALYDPIAVIDDEGVAQPYLVEALEANDDFTEWTITMRDGITFHNGDPLTPEVMAEHIKTMQLAPLTSLTFGPVNAVAVVDEAAAPRHDAGEISDDEYDVLRRQVVVNMKEPWSTFPAFLASYQVGYVAHPDYVDGTVEDPIGTGPFVFQEWIDGDHMTARRNTDYWREGLPYLDEVEFRIMTDAETRLNALNSGDIDLMVTNSASQVVELATEGVADDQVMIEGSGEDDEQVIAFNTQTGPTSDVGVRRALQLATDRAALNDQLYDGYYALADTPYREDSFWYADPGWPEPDVEAAAELVDEWEAENGPLAISLGVYNRADDLALGQTIQAQWNEAGIDTNIEAIDETAATTEILMGNYEAFLAPFMNGSDPDEHYPFWDPSPERIGAPGELSVNMTRYTSPTMQESLAAARRTADPEERQAEYAKVWQDWGENVPWLFLYHTQYLLVASDRVHGMDSFTTPEGDPAASFIVGSLFLTEVWRT